MNKGALVGYVREHLTRTLRLEVGLSAQDLMARDPDLGQQGATFITLTAGGRLRGCIGTLQAHRSLAQDLLDNALSAATRDPRFPPLTATELSTVRVEVSILSTPVPLAYDGPDDLLQKLRPGIDGVILTKGKARATFLPQVWETLPNPEDFLRQLSLKAGMGAQGWREGVTVKVYQVEKFKETMA